MRLTLGQIEVWMQARGGFDRGAEAVGYGIDSRTIGSGELFFAVRGERLDGHDFVESALDRGAVAAVVGEHWKAPLGVAEERLMRVPVVSSGGEDAVLVAMQRLAREVRRVWGGILIGVTGSAGKTTTKECIAAVLETKFLVLKTEGNLNNHFGVPLTLLRLQKQHAAAVLEMGMNHGGEIRALAAMAEPDWGVVSNVGPVHLEFFADGIQGIARAKYELVEALPANGIAFLNGDDALVRGFARGIEDRAVMYGTSEGCAVRAEAIKDQGLVGIEFELVAEPGADSAKLCWTGMQPARRRVKLSLAGRHNVMNALAAVAVGCIRGVELEVACRALEQMRPTEKRGNVIAWRGAELVNDTYNSNPLALKSMVEALRRTKARRRIVVVGEMLELGPEGARLHAACGEAMQGIDVVLGVRGLARELVNGARTLPQGSGPAQAEFVETPEQAGDWLRQHLREGDVALLKASRGVRLERALESLGSA